MGQWHRVKNLLLSMTAYRFPYHGHRSFTFAFGWRLTFTSLWCLFLQLSFWTEARMPCGKDVEMATWHGVKNLLLSMTAYRFPHHDRRSFVRLKMTLSRQAYIFRLPPLQSPAYSFPSSQFILMTGSQRHEKTVAFHHCLFISYELILPCPWI